MVSTMYRRLSVAIRMTSFCAGNHFVCFSRAIYVRCGLSEALMIKMPLIKLKHVASFSSEDPAHPAEHLLKPETYRKWQCASPGEKQVSVIMELEKSSKIHSVDIGNNGSAFVEVLVGRSSDTSNDFQVLLVASSFMSPAESKSGANSNRVRMFGHEKLSKAVAEQKWDRVKFVCTQPYNKTSCYGLSFINLHSPPVANTEQTALPKEKVQLRLGAFLLKDEATVPITTGSLFKKRKESGGSNSTITAAAELREASKSHDVPLKTTSTTVDLVNKTIKHARTEEQKDPNTTAGAKRTHNSMTSTTSCADATKVTTPRTSRPPTKKLKVVSRKADVPFNEILKDAIFVLSGFKNPERGHLRDKALSMGARYRGDWDNSCTHLICAFLNTPKYNQVKATRRGRIVSKNWVNDCHKNRRRMSEKRYRLKEYSSEESDSSSTEEEKEYNTKQNIDERPSSSTVSSATKPCRNDEVDPQASTSREAQPELAEQPKSTSDIVSKDPSLNREHSEDELSSGHDTEDEIRRVMKDEEDDDLYGGSTEDETDQEDNTNEKDDGQGPSSKSSTTNLLELPEFFSNIVFLLYGEFEHDERRMLSRYITAYNGELVEYMSDKVKFVLTYENWDDNFNEALVDNSCLTFVRPKWIYECHEKRSFVPFQPYIVVPR